MKHELGPKMYRLWQKPFLRPKLAPLLNDNEFVSAKSLLEVGCGPGLLTPFFPFVKYVGVDNNADYISHAQTEFPSAEFRVDDATRLETVGPRTFPSVLMHSLSHHLDDAQFSQTLESIHRCLTDEGFLFFVDATRTSTLTWYQRMLLEHDQGSWFRSPSALAEQIERKFEIQMTAEFAIPHRFIPLYRMIFFRAVKKVSIET